MPSKAPMLGDQQARGNVQTATAASSPSARQTRLSAALATSLQRAVLSPSTLTSSNIQQLQRKIGNRAVGRLLAQTAQLPTGQRQKNRTGLPDHLKAGIEQLSGLSMDDVTVHYNSARPVEVQALAYTQGANIHVAAGQEKYLPHEAWHAVQQKQGRVKPTLEAEGVSINDDIALEGEADRMGAKALDLHLPEQVTPGANIQAMTTERRERPQIESSEDPIQGVFTFLVNTDTYKIYNAQYFRVQQVKYMTGNKEFKHVTADTVKDALFTGLEGLALDVFAERVLDISDQYLHLPGLALLETHKLFDDDNPNYKGTNIAMIENFAEFEKVMDDIPRQSSELTAVLQHFKSADNKEKKTSAAFFTQNKTMILLASLEKFRDLMPLVNIVSGIQKGGIEREAKAFLETGIATKNVSTDIEALWGFFDFAAIDELSGKGEAETLQLIGDAIPWMDIDAFISLVAEKRRVEPHEMSETDLIDVLAGLMLGNHIKLMTLSYPVVAERAKPKLDTVESVMWALKKHDSPVDRKVVAEYAVYGW